MILLPDKSSYLQRSSVLWIPTHALRLFKRPRTKIVCGIQVIIDAMLRIKIIGNVPLFPPQILRIVHLFAGMKVISFWLFFFSLNKHYSMEFVKKTFTHVQYLFLKCNIWYRNMACFIFTINHLL